MEMKRPKISVMIPCYNHEKFIACAIDSVLAQTYKDYELIVCDNGSTDNCAKIIDSYGDRIKVITMEENNPMLCQKKLLEATQGEYIAFLCSDDYWYPEKLEYQMNAVENNQDCQIFFTWANMVDCNLDKVIDDSVFVAKNKKRAEWIRELLEKGTNLEYSSLLIKNDGRFQKYYKRVNQFRQLPDLKFYYNIVMEEPIYVVEKVLVKHRMHGANMSAPTTEVQIRSTNEHAYIYYDIWRRMTDEDYVQAYIGTTYEKAQLSKTEIMCQRIIRFLNMGLQNQMLSNYSFAYYWEHCEDEGVQECLENKYNFSLNDFHELTAKNGMSKVLLEMNNLRYQIDLMNTIRSIISCNNKIIELRNSNEKRSALIEAAKTSLDTLQNLCNDQNNNVIQHVDLLTKGFSIIQELNDASQNRCQWDELIELLKIINQELGA